VKEGGVVKRKAMKRENSGKKKRHVTSPGNGGGSLKGGGTVCKKRTRYEKTKKAKRTNSPTEKKTGKECAPMIKESPSEYQGKNG